MTERTGNYAFPHAGADERRRLELFAERLDPLTVRRIKALGLARGARCLEVGGGRGSIARWLCEHVGPDGRVTATDLETGFLSELSLPNLDVLRHDVTSDEFPDRSFDLVHVRAVLMHIPDRWPCCGGWSPGWHLVAGCWRRIATSVSGWPISTQSGPPIPAPGIRPSRTVRWRKAGRFSGRFTSWAWRRSAPTLSSTSSGPERHYRSSTSSASPPWPGR